MSAIWRPLLLVAGLIAAGVLLRTAPGGASGLLDRVGAEGRVPFVVVAAAACAVGLPRQIVAYAAALTFGAWPGIGLALVAQLLGCLANVASARLLGRDWAQRAMRRYVGGRGEEVDGFLSDNPFAATLMLRLLPVGNNTVLNLLAGVSQIAVGPFLLASAIGYLPQTIVFSLLGAGTRVDHATQMALGLALFAVSAALGLVLLRRFRSVASSGGSGLFDGAAGRTSHPGGC